MLGFAAPGAVVLLNSPHSPEATWAALPRDWQETVIAKKLKLYVIDAPAVSPARGMGRRTNASATCGRPTAP